MLREFPANVAKAVTGLTEEKAEAASRQFKAEQALELTMVDLADLLSGRGFPKSLPEKCVVKIGATAPVIIRNDPYVLLQFSGVGFLTADRLYLELGHDPAAIKRQGMCLWYSVYSDSEGHTWFPVEYAVRFLRQSIASTDIKPKEALEWATQHGRLVQREVDGKIWVADAGLAVHEANIVNSLWQAESETASRWPDPTKGEGPSDHQREEMAKAFAGVIGVLAGSPGTGKTWVTAWVIKTLGLGPDRVAVCAPTGKAAVRITESLAEQGVRLQAKTIHSTLGVIPSDGGWEFSHNADNPLSFDYVFVDESSMIDTPLMSALLSARGHAHVLFVGDPDQLSPVGPGAPLRDMIAAGVPCGHLKEIRRNAGQIVKTCAAIRDHQRMEWSETDCVEIGDNLMHYEWNTPDEQINGIKGHLKIVQDCGDDPVWDAQVLAAVNEKSPLGRKQLNRILQGYLNPDGKQAQGNPFRIGDKIICTRNGDLPLLEGAANDSADGERKTRVANGELARVQKVTATYTEASLQAPDRLVRIPKGKSDDSDTGCNWELGYAISTHKSQGSEWPVCLIVIDSHPGAVRLCDKHWIYTAISRAKNYAVTIGKQTIAEAMPRKSHMWRRKTFLREDLESVRLADMFQFWETGLEVDDHGKEESGQEAEASHGEVAPGETRGEGA
jgi:exodeoxyribonuclease V alpha subunit